MKHRILITACGLLAIALSLLWPTPLLADTAEDLIGSTVCIGGALLFLIINIAILIWVIRDAQARGSSAGAWVIIVLLFGVLGLLAYLVARPKGKLVPCPECGKQKPITDTICPHCGKRVV